MERMNKAPRVVMVSVSKLVRDDTNNPNVMEEEEERALVKVIKDTGMVQPILVTSDGATPETYTIVDGHHRADAAAEAGIDKVLAVVFDGSSAQRKALTLSMNKIRGKIDLNKAKDIIIDLRDTWNYDLEQLEMTGFTKEELETLLSFKADLDAEDIMEDPIAPPAEEDEGIEKIFLLELTFQTSEQLKLARRALKKAAGRAVT
jgi:ParB/RepB/Spo0J family partition protein